MTRHTNWTGKEVSPLWVRDTRKPAVATPPGAWDCAAHVFGDSVKYPVRNTRYPPIPADIGDLLGMHRTIGVEGGTLVQPILYGTDHSVIIDALRIAGDRYLGIAVVDDTLSDRDLALLNDAGFCNARYNFYALLGITWDRAAFERSLARIAEFGWSATIHFAGPDVIEWESVFRKIKIPVVIDHFGHFDLAGGLDQKPMHLMLDFMKDGWWMKLSNGDRVSMAGYPFEDTIAFAQRLVAVSPDRCMWGTDWPHPIYHGDMPNDADLIELFFRHVPDAEQRRKILVDNPRRFFGAPKGLYTGPGQAG